MFRHSICNEIYQPRGFAETCRSAAEAGYRGLEIAPFTLAEDATAIPAAARRELRDIMGSEGLNFAGLHWLMVGPKGLHVTTPDAAVRARSWEYVRRLIDLCADLGRGVMVFGSPKQRASTGGLSRKEALQNFIAGLGAVAPHAEERGVEILVEALPADQGNDVVNTLDEAAEVVYRVASPAVATMFDAHNTADEREPGPQLIERHHRIIRHVHLNEMDGRHPGTGSYDFHGVLQELAMHGYDGWLSLEVFDFTPGADTIARESLRYIEEIL